MRPRLRLYPERALVGIRAATPNALWHLDTTMVRLVDHTRVHICAVIDNASRMILAWRVADRLTPMLSCEVLADAAKWLPQNAAQGSTAVLVDGGVENLSATTSEFLEQHRAIQRVLAQVEIPCSNSMIEAMWRSLKHNWLYLHTFDSVAAVQRLMAFFVEQHNCVMPHSAFEGQTPQEMYLGTGGAVEAELRAGHARARIARLALNRAKTCATCARGGDAKALAPPVRHDDKPV